MRTTFRAVTGFMFVAVGFLLWLVPSGLLRLVFDNLTWVCHVGWSRIFFELMLLHLQLDTVLGTKE